MFLWLKYFKGLYLSTIGLGVVLSFFLNYCISLTKRLLCIYSAYSILYSLYFPFLLFSPEFTLLENVNSPSSLSRQIGSNVSQTQKSFYQKNAIDSNPKKPHFRTSKGPTNPSIQCGADSRSNFSP